MQVEISAMIEDYDILAYVSEREQAKVIDTSSMRVPKRVE